MIRSVGAAVREVVYPKRCGGCGARGAWVCADCSAALELFAPPWCAGCGIPVRIGPCRCHHLPTGIEGVRAVGPFAGWLRGAIIAFKYEDEPDRAEHLGGLLAERVAEFGPDLLVMPVPLHPSRSKRRGYNQSALVADRIAARFGWTRADGLVRTRATDQQAKLGADARRSNVAGAFALSPSLTPDDLSGRTVLLIDDVFTTGSTAGACAEVLAAAGAARVVVGVLAREA